MVMEGFDQGSPCDYRVVPWKYLFVTCLSFWVTLESTLERWSSDIYPCQAQWVTPLHTSWPQALVNTFKVTDRLSRPLTHIELTYEGHDVCRTQSLNQLE